MVGLKGLGRMDGLLDGIRTVCFFPLAPGKGLELQIFLVQSSPAKDISSLLSIPLEARLSDRVNLTLLPL